MLLVDIAKKLDVSEGTVRSWKNRYKFGQDTSATLQKNQKRNVAKKRRGGQPGNKNATGPPGNKHAERHGLFCKHLPSDTLSIIEDMSLDPLDVLWGQIQIAYAAIIRAQKIMYVKDIDDSTTTKIEEKSGNVCGERWEVQQAWDKQANFLKAQARAQGELRSMIKQYDELLCKNYELATEEQKARIELLKARTKSANKEMENGDVDNSENIEAFLKALRPTEEELHDLFGNDVGDENNGEETEETE